MGTRKEFLQISNVLSLLENSLKMEGHFLTTTSKRRALFILCSVFVEVCKSSSKLWLVKPSPLRLSHQIPLKMSRPRSKTRKVFPQISNVLSLLENSLKMEGHFPTITSKRRALFILCSVFVEVCKSSSKL